MSFPRYPKYKDSGVEWLGEVPEHWDTRRLRWLVMIQKRIAGTLGYDVLAITQQGVKVKDLEANEGQFSMDYSKYQIVYAGDFAMNHMDLLTGYIDISRYAGVTSPDYRVFTTKNRSICEDRYLLYIFQMGYRNKIFYAFGQGSSQLGRWRFPTEEFNNFTFPLPPMTEQQDVVTFLDRETGKIDALVAEQQRLIELLKEKRQAVISHAVTKGLNPNAPMKPSGIEWLGDVPEHWELKRLKYLASDNNGIQMGPFGGMLLELDFEETGFKVYGQENTISGDFGLGTRWISKDRFETLANYQIQSGDLVLTRKGSLGNARLIKTLPHPGIADSDTIRLRLKENMVRSDFVELLLHTAEYVSVQIALSKRGAILSGLNSETIANISIVLPPLATQLELMQFLKSRNLEFDENINTCERAIDLLQERRTALISAAVTGKIDVRGLASSSMQ